jgi:hypothetical protein
MKATILLLCLFCQLSLMAQREKAWGDPHVMEKLAAAANKNPEYKKLTAQIRELSLTATRNNTNAAKVKALINSNNLLLKNLYTGAGITAPQTLRSAKTIKPNSILKTSNFFAINKLKLIPNQEMTKTITPPFQDAWEYKFDHSNDGGYPDSSLSDFATGLIAFKANSEMICETYPNINSCKLGIYQLGYQQQFTVPNNPEIIAAEISFEYDYLYTGWDTYGAITGIDMIVHVNDKLSSQAFNEMPDANLPVPASFGIWKKMSTIFSLDTVEASFGEFHANGSSTFKLEGYVTPGTTIEVKMGIGYPSGTKRGMYGCYHYGEMKLKKITVKYFKSTANN